MILFTLQVVFIATLLIFWLMFIISVLANWWVKNFPKTTESAKVESDLSRKDVVALIKAELKAQEEK